MTVLSTTVLWTVLSSRWSSAANAALAASAIALVAKIICLNIFLPVSGVAPDEGNRVGNAPAAVRFIRGELKSISAPLNGRREPTAGLRRSGLQRGDIL